MQQTASYIKIYHLRTSRVNGEDVEVALVEVRETRQEVLVSCRVKYLARDIRILVLFWIPS